MEPLKVKMTYHQILAMGEYVYNKHQMASHPQAREELIVLAEYMPKLERSITTAMNRVHHKEYTYKMPVSVARILHRRWQQEFITFPLQAVLGRVDYALTQRRLKPDPVKPELF